VTVVGIHSAGHMGSGLGWALRSGGATVITTVDGRSARTARLAADAGLTVVGSLDEVVRRAAVILVVTPPGAAVAAATELGAAAARAGATPLIADLNAVSPATVREVAGALAPLDLVDGSISGAPPTVRPGTRLYFSGPRAAEVAALPWQHVETKVIDDRLGSASALKMCTASVYKGTVGLYAQAMRVAAEHGVLDDVLADLADGGRSRMPYQVALAASKAQRYVPEMREIAATQRAAGLTPDLFEAFAEVWAGIAGTELAGADPESVSSAIEPDEVVRRLR
jgi:3-hydroxyisobutyrate dehydrogenase-like beta-hydroxyacid dehydrogenase